MSIGGEGRVSSEEDDISCPTKCSAPFTVGDGVLLTASAGEDWAFARWVGTDCGAQPTCFVRISEPTSVRAEFVAEPARFTLTVNVIVAGGTGRVEIRPPGRFCSGECSLTYLSARRVTLTAIPSEASQFNGWGGACEGTERRCRLTVNGDRAVTANFGEKVVD